MSVPLQALRGFPYAGRRLAAGEKFEARGESDARVLCAVGHATRHIQVPEPLPEIVAPVATKRGKGYRTQALVAEAAADAAPETPGASPLASEAQASESGTAEKPEPGKLETAPSEADAAPARRRYSRRDQASGADE